ncbi:MULTISPECIES: homoserine dehydrogenase [Bacillaceae]|uniref:Homoserine dehydrogenase n=1 Tax=Evansella alkalicola TaxID=745819 RepID=A0ABS6JR35_9BACI|nr:MULTISPECIES: homoserine dehydrogenase [Bacillaceae]MBU9721018.1 homoserine dehydrogenase [Bacillus alkalicola]
MSVKIAFIGFGGVGQSLANLLWKQQEELREKYGLEPIIVAVSDMMKGSIYSPEGLDIPILMDSLQKTGNVEDYEGGEEIYRGWDSFETIKNSNADVIVEVTFTDVETGQPAIDHCRTAFRHQKSVVTTNKGPVALAYEELSLLARENNAYWGFEGTVMSGTPALRMPVYTLAGNEITKIKGILNGTTNFMLTEMEKGHSYEESLKKAQELGYAEADPTSDVEGYDARYKAVILANYLMGGNIKPEEVQCEGITGITEAMIKEALSLKKRWRLLAKIKKDGDHRITAEVKPECINEEDPLAGVTGATNGILYECDLAGPILLTGAGAGLEETAYSLLIDLIDFKRNS